MVKGDDILELVFGVERDRDASFGSFGLRDGRRGKDQATRKPLNPKREPSTQVPDPTPEPSVRFLQRMKDIT